MSRPTLRAPAGQGEVLARPPLGEAGSLLQANQAQLAAATVDLCGQPLNELRRSARSEVEGVSRRFMIRHGLPVPSSEVAGFVVTGHQPELFHPGVWVKNFAACAIARRFGLTGLSLIVDNDHLKSVAVKLPQLTRQGATLVQVPLDRWSGPAPHEDLAVQDEATFAAFPEAVTRIARDWPFRPVVTDLWKLAGKGPLLGERLIVGRHRLEETWGCTNLEVPLGALCGTETFARFACHLLGDLPRFWSRHNEQLAEYRRRYRLRSKNHPVPELTQQDDWLEAPFWVWRAGETQRHRLFVRRVRDLLELRYGTMVVTQLPISSKPDAIVSHFKEIATQGYKLRTRALTTTLFMRLCVADLFIHGIGGSIYDELTDSILRTYYGIEPPQFLTLSATLRLPFAMPRVSADSLQVQRLALRDLRYKPEDWLRDRGGQVQELCAAKRRLVWQSPADADAKLQRWRAIQRLNEELRPYVAAERSRLVEAVQEQEAAAEAAHILQDREYAFCLHPENRLRGLMEKVL